MKYVGTVLYLWSSHVYQLPRVTYNHYFHDLIKAHKDKLSWTMLLNTSCYIRIGIYVKNPPCSEFVKQGSINNLLISMNEDDQVYLICKPIKFLHSFV